MAYVLNLYKKGETKPTVSGDPVKGVAITGVPAGTKINDGDYQSTFTDDTGKLAESDKVDVPGVTVNPAK